MIKTYISIISITLVILAISCKSGNKENAEKEKVEDEVITSAEFTPVQFKNAGIKLGRIEYRNLRAVVKTSGYLEVPPQNKANVAPIMGGIIKEIFVQEGNYVKTGQMLAKLQHPDFIKLQEEYIKSLADFTYLEKEYTRQKELRAGNVNAEKVFQQTESEYKAGRGRVHSLEAQLRMLSLDIPSVAEGNISPSVSVYSPISGYVGHINASVGKFAEPNQSIFDIVDNSKVHVDLMVYEKDIFKVKTGQKVDFMLTNQNNSQIRGEIFGISKSFENETKALVVHANIIQKTSELIPGMFVNAFIETGNDSVLALPQAAIVHEAGKDYIFIKTANEEKGEKNIVFKRIQVKTGFPDLGYIEIKSMEEIPENAEVAIEGAFYIQSIFKPGEDEE
jgi:membrane fusion protein, heavy metal efflux system